MPFPFEIFEDACIFGILLGVPLAIVVAISLSRWHWLIRLSTPVVGAWLLIPAKAYAASEYFLLTAGQVVLVLAVVRWWQDRRRGEISERRSWRFSLRDLLLMTALVAAACGVGVLARNERGNFAAFSSTPASLIVLATTWGAFDRKSVLRATVWLFTLIFATAVWFYVNWFDLEGVRGAVGLVDIVFDIAVIASDVLFGAILAFCISVTLVALTMGTPPVRWPIAYRVVSGFLVGVAVLLGGYFYYRLVEPISVPVVRLPSPNGHDYLIQAAKTIGKAFPDLDLDPPEKLVAYVMDNQQAFSLIRSGLDLQSQVPLVWEDEEGFMVEEFREIEGVRAIARGFPAEARMRARAGDLPGAARSCVDCIRFSHEWSRGGLQIHYLVAISVEGAGTNELISLVPQLDSVTCRTTIAALADVDARRESVVTIEARDELWTLVRGGWLTRTLKARRDLFQQSTPWPTVNQKFQDVHDATRRLLITQLAVRAFVMDHGYSPQSFDEMIPEYLATIPVDPFSGAPLRFTVVDESVAIYSVGPDGDDDGGQQLTWAELMSADDGDFRLGTLTAVPNYTAAQPPAK